MTSVVVLAVIVLLQTIGCLTSLALGLARYQRTRKWTSATGVLVDRKTGLPFGRRFVQPDFQWRDAVGRVHQARMIVTRRPPPRLGTLVPVRFDPQQPSRGIVDTLAHNGMFSLVAGGVGLALGLGQIAVVIALAR